MSSDQEDRDDEILALQEICGPDFSPITSEERFRLSKSLETSHSEDPEYFKCGGRIKVSSDLEHCGGEISVKYRMEGGLRTLDFAVKHLPPFQLNFLLPENYPSEAMPLLSLECIWTTRRQNRKLLDELRALWDPGSVFLFSAINFLKEECLKVLGVNSYLNVTPVLIENKAREARKIAAEAKANSHEKSRHPSKAATMMAQQENISETPAAAVPVVGNLAEETPSHEATNHDVRYGFISKFVSEKSFGFIRCLEDGKLPPTSNDDYKRVKSLRTNGSQQSEAQVPFKDVFFHKRNVVVAQQGSDKGQKKVDFFRKTGTAVSFVLTVTKQNRTEAQRVRQHTIGQDSSANVIQQCVKPCDVEGAVGYSADSDTRSSFKSDSTCDITQGVVNKPKLPEVSDFLRSTPDLVKQMQEYHDVKEEESFLNGLFDCLVCYSTKPGAKCLRFPGCGHVYCKSCMKSYFEIQIEQGMMSNMTCPEDGCKSQALPTQIKDVVESSAYEMYENQLLQTTLESMTDIEFCPRLQCQCPTIVDREMNMGQCPKCHYAFCVLCKQAYHGQTPCSINSKEKIDLLEEYLNGTPERRKELEKRYGAKHLKHLSENYLSDVYMRDKAKKCPKCQTPIEKSDGCNKMTCHRCNTYFCYLCEAYLPRHNPYGHFSDRTTMCYNQLFQGIDNMDELVEDQFENFMNLDDWSDDEDDDAWFPDMVEPLLQQAPGQP